MPVGGPTTTNLPSHQLGDILLDEQGYLFVATWFDGIAYAKLLDTPFTLLGSFASRETLPPQWNAEGNAKRYSTG